MFQDKPAWVEHQRQLWLRPDADRWVRPDAHHFMPPGAPRLIGKDAVRYFWPDAANGQRAQPAEIKRDLDLPALRASLLRIKGEVAALQAEIKFWRFLRDLKAYNLNQPRVPAGNPDGGQWTAEGGSAPERIRLAGPLPTNDPPEIPPQRPLDVTARNAFLKSAARWLAGARALGARISPFVTALEAMSWIDTDRPFIESYQDLPKTLEELQQGALEGRKSGYNIHHIVEQTSAEKDGDFSRDQIDAPENLVRIPTLKHWEITGWFAKPNRNFGGQSPREWLRDKDWDVRRQLGLDALRDFGVLGP